MVTIYIVNVMQCQEHIGMHSINSFGSKCFVSLVRASVVR